MADPAVLWSPGLLGAYASAALPLPADALYCRAGQLSARILGQCDFGAQGGRSVEQSDLCAHGADHRRPAQRCHEVELPWSGHRQVRQHQWGFNSFLWDSTTNIRTDIPAPIGGLHPSVTDIGNNGNVIGSSKMNDGTRHAFKWTLVAVRWTWARCQGARTAEPSHSAARTDAIWQAAARQAQGRIYTQSCRTSAHRNCMNHLCSNRKWSIL